MCLSPQTPLDHHSSVIGSSHQLHVCTQSVSSYTDDSTDDGACFRFLSKLLALSVTKLF